MHVNIDFVAVADCRRDCDVVQVVNCLDGSERVVGDVQAVQVDVIRGGGAEDARGGILCGTRGDDEG